MTLKNLWSQRRDFVDRKDKTLEVVAFLDYDFYIKRKNNTLMQQCGAPTCKVIIDTQMMQDS